MAALVLPVIDEVFERFVFVGECKRRICRPAAPGQQIRGRSGPAVKLVLKLIEFLRVGEVTAADVVRLRRLRGRVEFREIIVSPEGGGEHGALRRVVVAVGNDEEFPLFAPLAGFPGRVDGADLIAVAARSEIVEQAVRFRGFHGFLLRGAFADVAQFVAGHADVVGAVLPADHDGAAVVNHA